MIQSFLRLFRLRCDQRVSNKQNIFLTNQELINNSIDIPLIMSHV